MLIISSIFKATDETNVLFPMIFHLYSIPIVNALPSRLMISTLQMNNISPVCMLPSMFPTGLDAIHPLQKYQKMLSFM